MLSAMFLMLTTQGVFEECSSETSSQEIELVLVRNQKERNTKQSDPIANWNNPVSQSLEAPKPLRNRFFSASTERAMLNGLGTYLLI